MIGERGLPTHKDNFDQRRAATTATSTSSCQCGSDDDQQCPAPLISEKKVTDSKRELRTRKECAGLYDERENALVVLSPVNHDSHKMCFDGRLLVLLFTGLVVIDRPVNGRRRPLVGLLVVLVNDILKTSVQLRPFFAILVRY